MKNKLWLISVVTAILFCFAACEDGAPDLGPENQNPAAGDYTIGNLSQTSGSVTAVTIAANSGKSPGAVSVRYNGNAMIPQTAGTYAVTFDVEAAEGWNAADNLAAGNLVVITAVFDSVADFAAWIKTRPTNSSYNAYSVKLNAGGSGGGSDVAGNIGKALKDSMGININRFVSLDLSGSAFTVIGDEAFIGCSGLTGITIPDSVTSIGDYAFDGCSNLIGINIPNGVNSIGKWAFNNCASLAGINIPNGVTGIGEYTFSNCSSLTGVTIPNSVTSIGNWAFGYCTRLTGVTISDNVTSIGIWAFFACTSLTGVTIPNKVTSIGSWAFVACLSLTGVTIPASVTSLGESVFSGCDSLTAINVDGANTAYSSVNGIVYNKSKTTLVIYPAGKTGAFTIPDSVTIIGEEAFSGCVSLTGVTIPDNVTSIGTRAFWNCSSLTNVTIPSSVTSIGLQAFAFCDNLTSVTFATGSNIADANFGNIAFPPGEVDSTDEFGGNNSLKTAYNAASPKAGTYTRAANGDTWTKL